MREYADQQNIRWTTRVSPRIESNRDQPRAGATPQIQRPHTHTHIRAIQNAPALFTMLPLAFSRSPLRFAPSTQDTYELIRCELRSWHTPPPQTASNSRKRFEKQRVVESSRSGEGVTARTGHPAGGNRACPPLSCSSSLRSHQARPRQSQG